MVRFVFSLFLFPFHSKMCNWQKLCMVNAFFEIYVYLDPSRIFYWESLKFGSFMVCYRNQAQPQIQDCEASYDMDSLQEHAKLTDAERLWDFGTHIQQHICLPELNNPWRIGLSDDQFNTCFLSTLSLRDFHRRYQRVVVLLLAWECNSYPV